MDEQTLSIQNTQTEPKPSFIQRIKAKIPPKIQEMASKFYAKKIVFWPVTIVFSLLFLTILLGLIFGNRSSRKEALIPSPTPLLTGPVVPSESGSLTQTEADLEILRQRINTFDVRQGRLKPPTLNFDVEF